MEQDLGTLYAKAEALARHTNSASCEWLQFSLETDWALARRVHTRLIAERTYLQSRQHLMKPPLAGRHCVRLLGAGRAGNTALQGINSNLPGETIAGFELDAEGRLHLGDEYGHYIGRVPLSDKSDQRLALFEALSRATRIAMIVGDPNELDAEALLPMLAQGAKRAGAWVVWMDCSHASEVNSRIAAHSAIGADLVFTASSFSIPGIDAGQTNLLGIQRVLDMLTHEFGCNATVNLQTDPASQNSKA